MGQFENTELGLKRDSLQVTEGFEKEIHTQGRTTFHYQQAIL